MMTVQTVQNYDDCETVETYDNGANLRSRYKLMNTVQTYDHGINL